MEPAFIGNRFRSFPLVFGLLVLATLAAAPAARANTYRFNFRTTDLLDALAAANPPDIDHPDGIDFFGFFSFFMQPLDSELPSGDYTYGMAFSPKPSGDDKWEAGMIAGTHGTPALPGPNGDYLGPGSGTWAYFSKEPNQALVTLVGLPTAADLFITDPPTGPYYDNGVYPFGFGCLSPANPAPGACASNQVLNSFMASSALWTIEIITPLILNDPIQFTGYGSALEGNPFFIKTATAIPFTMLLTPEPVPEPATFGLLGTGALALFWFRLRYQRNR